jgi:hypothetical protein
MAFLGTPVWWAEANRDELAWCKNAAGEVFPFSVEGIEGEFMGDYSSEKWRDDLGMALKEYLRHVKASEYAERVIGFHIVSAGPSNEWFTEPGEEPISFSPAGLAGFRSWLKARHGSLDALNRAWGTSHRSFAEIEPPWIEERNAPGYGSFRDPIRQRMLIDHDDFQADSIAECIEHFARIVKAEHGGLVCVFHGYINEFGHERVHDGAMLSIHRVLSSPDVDMVTAPDGYRSRRPGGFPYYMNLVDSVRLHGKVWLAQNDYRTLCDPDLPKTQFTGRTGTLDENINQMRYVFLQDLTHSCPPQFHDQTYHRYEAPGLPKAAGECAEVFRKAMQVDRRLVHEIAFVEDPYSCYFYGRRNPFVDSATYKQLREFGAVGAPFGVWDLNDLAAMPAQRFWFFANCAVVNDELCRVITARMAAEKALALWGYGTGLYSASGVSATNICRLSGFEVRADLNTAPARVEYVTGEVQECDPDNPATRPLIYIPQANELEVLARHHDGRVAMAARDMDGWVSVCCGVPQIPTSILRQLSERAGVHHYCEAGDTVFANRSFLGVMSRTEGARTICLQQAGPVTDAFTGELVSTGSSTLDAEFAENQARLFYLGDAQHWAAGLR